MRHTIVRTAVCVTAFVVLFCVGAQAQVKAPQGEVTEIHISQKDGMYRVVKAAKPAGDNSATKNSTPKVRTTGGASGDFVMGAVDGELFVIQADIYTSKAAPDAGVVRLGGKRISLLHQGYSESINPANPLTSGGFFGLASLTPFEIIGRKQVSATGTYPDGSGWSLVDSLLSPQLDQISACMSQDGTTVSTFWRVRGHQPNYPPFPTYPFTNGGFSGTLSFFSLEGTKLPCPVWLRADIPVAAWDPNFAGANQFQMEVPNSGLSPDNWITEFYDAATLANNARCPQ